MQIGQQKGFWWLWLALHSLSETKQKKLSEHENTTKLGTADL